MRDVNEEEEEEIIFFFVPYQIQLKINIKLQISPFNKH